MVQTPLRKENHDIIAIDVPIELTREKHPKTAL